MVANPGFCPAAAVPRSAAPRYRGSYEEIPTLSTGKIEFAAGGRDLRVRCRLQPKIMIVWRAPLSTKKAQAMPSTKYEIL
jgi:hypothetical protein